MHSGIMLKRARERYEREAAGPDESRRKPRNSPLSLKRGASHRSIKLQPIAKALGPEKTAALPAFHAIYVAS